MRPISAMLKYRVGRYVLSGIISFIIENLAFLIFYYPLHIEVKTANILSVAIAMTSNFFVSKSFVFNLGIKSGRLHRQFVKYIILVVFNLTVSTTLIAFLVHHGLAGAVAKPLISILIAGWTYLIYKKLIFKPSIVN